MEFPKIRDWNNKKILARIGKNWNDRIQIQSDLNTETLNKVKTREFEERINPDNAFTISDKAENNDALAEIINESQQPELDWNKVAPLMRHENEEHPIIMDNVNEVVMDNANANALGIKASNLSVWTSYFDHSSKKWLESKRASHPFISVKMTKIDPKKNNKDDSSTTTQCVMADSGAMCSLLNFKMVEDMGIVPEDLETSNVSITGVKGKKLQSVTRQMHLKIVNTKNGAESWEKVYVSPEIKTSLVSKDCLIRLTIFE